jgi:hypothetical protein
METADSCETLLPIKRHGIFSQKTAFLFFIAFTNSNPTIFFLKKIRCESMEWIALAQDKLCGGI